MELLRNKEGIYIYGIIPTYYDAEQFRKLDGIEVYNIPLKKVSAIVSKKWIVDYQHLSTEKLARLLVDHQRTIESLMNMGFSTIIPMRIGTFADNQADVINILEKSYDLIMETFEKITNFIEVDVVAIWSDFNKIISEVGSNAQVAEIKAKIQSKNTEITQTDQLSIGIIVKKLLDEKREEYSTKILDVLNPICLRSKDHEVMNDQMVTNTAFLINRNQSIVFENALDKLDESMDGLLNFKLVGPLPCYSFYTFEIKNLRYEEIDLARQSLGLEDQTSEKKIKQAYLEKVKLFHPDKNAANESAESFDMIKKAFHTLTDYVHAVKPASPDEVFTLQRIGVAKNSLLLKIIE